MTPNRALAATAAVLALLALAAASSGDPRAPGAGPGVAELSAELAAGGPVVDAVTLGRWIRDRRSGLAIVDVRDTRSFVQYAIPTATNLRLPALADSLSPDSEIVLYDDGAGDAARAWLLLRRLGYPRVRILERGLLGWIDDVMEPVLPADTSEQERRWDEVAGISRYFGGVPRVGTPETATDGARSAGDAVQLLTRRGCY